MNTAEPEGRMAAHSTEVRPQSTHTLAGFAAAVRDHYLTDFVQAQFDFIGEVELPMMQHLKHVPPEALMESAMSGALEFLGYLAADQQAEYIDLSLSRWRSDELGIVGKLQIEALDISGINYIRKKSVLKLLPRYTADIHGALRIAEEFDRFIYRLEKLSFAQLYQFHREAAESRQQFIEKVSAAVPGTLYVYGVQGGQVEYINDHLPTLLGYSAGEFDELGAAAVVSKIIHAADQEKATAYYRDIITLQDGEVRSHKHRFLHKNGSVLWVRSYDTPFRRAADGTLTHIVGFSFNITTEKEAAEALKEREAQLLEAQDIAQLGSYITYYDTGKSKSSPQINAIFELQNPDDNQEYLRNIHPDDVQMVLDRLKKAYEKTGVYHCTYRYTNSRGERYLDCRGRVSYNADGTPYSLSGTVQDVTEQQELLQKLRRSEHRFRLAEGVAGLGIFVWNVGEDTVTWSPELFRHYGLPAASDTVIDRGAMRSYSNEADVERIQQTMQRALRDHSVFEITYGITDATGKQKTLYSRGDFVADDTTGALQLIGIVQDVTEREALLERLRDSKARYKEAQAIARLGNWALDLTTKDLIWSDEMYRVYGLDPANATPPEGKAFAALLHPADRSTVLGMTTQMRTQPGAYTCQYRRRDKDGVSRWLHMRGESFAGVDGRIAKLRGTVQDITEQKQNETRLQSQQNFIRKVTDLAPSVINVFDRLTNQYEFVNEGLMTVLGYEPEALLRGGPEFVLSRCHPDDLPALTGLAGGILHSPLPAVPGAAEPVQETRYRICNAEGEYRWLHTYATVFSRADDGSVEKTLDISLDVTGQVLAEQASRENERFVRNVTHLVPSVIAVIDVDTDRYVFVNDTATSIFGQPKERFLQEGFSFILDTAHPEDVAAVQKSHETSIRESNTMAPDSPETVFEVQYRIKNAQGEYRWMRSLSTPFLRKPDGTVQQIISITQDVSPLHAAEEVLRHRALQLQQSNTSLEEFAYVASHDLQEPLRKISTFGDMLQKSGSFTDERGATYLTKIIDSAKRMQTLINDLLDISVISRQKAFENHSLYLLLREVLATLEHKIEATGAVIEAERLPDAVVIPAQIRQLFQNLLSNALKFRRPDGTPHVRISVSSLFAREAQELGLPGHLPYARIDFTDNGIGFSNEYATKIFTIFQRLHGRSEYEGSGIGLAICKKIAEHHGGTVYAKGEPGVGATFTVVLPV